MASTNKTPNYNLSQFQPTNKLERTDYNSDMDKIDTELKNNETNIELSYSRQPLTITSCSTQAELNAAIDNCHSIYGGRTKYAFMVGVGPANLSLPGGGTWSIEGETFWDGYEIQTAKSYMGTGRYKMRAKTGGVWSAWRDL